MRPRRPRMKFLSYSPDQIELLPPSAREVLGEDHLCFFVRRVVARLNLSAIEQAYRRRPARLSPGVAGVGVALRLRAGDHQRAAAGATDSGRLGEIGRASCRERV